jgi:RNA polymerase sigma-70 factor (ECF subfamily)
MEGMGDDDREILERIQQGDAESFGRLYDRTRNWLLFFVIVPRVGREQAEDVLSETFRTALGKIHSFRWQGIGLLHWLAAIARRKALEHGRQKYPRIEALEDLPSLLEMPDDTPTAEAEMIFEETLRNLRERVSRTLATLPSRYAEALRMRLLEGRSRQECAGRLSVATSTFDVVLYRATRAFAREWKKE